MLCPMDWSSMLDVRRWALDVRDGGFSARRAFTLVEVLTVLAIMGIITLVSMPYFVKSIRGNRLRVATGTVMQAGRYARSMALLGEQEMRLTFDLNESAVRVNPRYDQAPSSRPVASGSTADGSDQSPPPSADTNDTPPQLSPGLSISRKIEDVRIDYVEVDHQTRESTGIVTVIYRSNGRCSPYTVRLVDEFGAATVTRVDALSTPNSEREDR